MLQIPTLSQSADHSKLAFWAFLLLHLVLWTAVPTLTQPNAPLDTIEMLYWGHEWQLGYYKHPPLPGWIAETACMLLGRADWPTYLAAQLCVVTCFWAVWQLGREFLKPWQALAAVALLEASYYYNYTTPELNNNVVSRALWAFSILCFYRAVSRQQHRWWILTGLSLAVGMLSRYDTAVLGATMVGFLVVHPRMRPCWGSPGPYLTIATALIVLSPHLIWLIECDFPTIRYFLNRSESNGGWVRHLVNPLRFLFSQLGAVLPILLLALPIVTSWKPRHLIGAHERFQRDFILGLVLGPVALICGASFLVGFKIQSMWGTALWSYSGLLVLFLFPLHEDQLSLRRLLTLSATATLLFAAILTARNIGSPQLRHKGSRIHFPGKQLACEVERRWHERLDRPLKYVGGEWWYAGNVAFYAEHRASVFADLSSAKSPWVDDQKIQEYGGVVIWPEGIEGEQLRAAIIERFPDGISLPVFEVAWQTRASLPPVRMGMTIIPPVNEVIRK